jgi:hypothetical protein
VIGFLFITGRAGAHWAAIRQAESRLPLKEIGWNTFTVSVNGKIVTLAR